VRVCLVYDCLFPWTVGGAERWYRNLGERLAADGHEVTYLTLRQWEHHAPPDVRGVRVRAVGPRLALYGRNGNRRIFPPLVFGAGVLWHLVLRGRRYDVVHTASFPYFSLLAAGAARLLHRYGLVVDWHEVWSRRYWGDYLGQTGGAIGHAVQTACTRIPQRAFCFSRLHRDRLVAAGLRDAPTVLEGEYEGPLEPPMPVPADPVVVFAGRHIAEKRAAAIVPAVRLARRRLPYLRGEIYGDGPERSAVQRAIAAEGMTGIVEAPGFVPSERVQAALARALCMVLPSRREGYGLIVVEAAAAGVPSVVTRDEDNAAVELVEEGVNGFVTPSADPAAIAEAIVRVHEAGPALRSSTAEWFAANAERLSLGSSLEIVLRAYAR
jgi:glycosyltransferase involved in cell wall biosynthesis